MKKILSVLMCVMMIACMMPGVAMADEIATEMPAPDNGKITLTGDVELSSTYDVEGDLIIDLAGHSIIGTDTKASGNFYLIQVDAGESLTIEDSMEGGSITLTSTYDRNYGASSAVISNEQGTVTINGGTISNLGGNAMAYAIDIRTNQDGDSGNACLYINSGTVTSTYYAVRIVGNTWANSTDKSTVEFKNGSIEGNGAFLIHNMTADNDNAIELIVDGGTIDSTTALYVWDSTGASLLKNTNIDFVSGNVEGGFGFGFNSGVELDLDIFGGTYSEDVSSYVIPGMKYDTETKQVVIDEEKAVAKIGSMGYTSLQAAANSITGSELTTITVLNNIEITDGTPALWVSGNKNIKLDIGTYTISSNSPNYTIAVSDTNYTYNEGTATAAKLTIVGTGTITNTSSNSSTIRSYGDVVIGEAGQDGPTITRDVTSETANSAIKVDEDSTLVVNSGTIDGSARSIQSFGTTTINGGLIKKVVSVNAWENYTSTVYVKGGEVQGDITVVAADTNVPTVTATGGKFTMTLPAEYIAEGYEQGTDGVVKQKPAAPEDDNNDTPVYYPTVTIEKPIIESADNATVTLGILGTTATIAPTDGYEIADVTVNGVSKGAVTSLSGLKTGDKIVVTTKAIEAPKTEAEIVQEQLDGMQLVARSKRTAAPSGKNSIMVYWYDKAGADVDFDGVEIFRSTKKSSGFKKVFTSKTDKYYNTAIEEGVKYYYKVRGFVEVDGEKLYTDWSLKAIRTAK